MSQDQGSTPCPCFKINKLLQGVGLKKEDLRTMENRFVYEVEIPLFWRESFPQMGGIYGIENEKHEIFLEHALSHDDKKQNILNYRYYDFEEEIDCPGLIKALKYFVSNYDFKHAETKEVSTILEFTVDFKNNYYFKGTYQEGENDYDSARYHCERVTLGKKNMLKASENLKYFIQGPNGYINYAEILFDVVNQTDHENWQYFSEESSALAKDFLDYGYFSRVLMMRDRNKNKVLPVGYVQVRVLKKTAPQLLYKDLYHQVGLKGCELWEENAQLKAGSPLYVDVIAVKQEFQQNRNILKLIPGAMKDIIAEIHNTTHSPFDIYGVGVTAEGRKMCRMLGMQQVSEVVRTDCQSGQARTLFRAEYHDFTTRLEKMTRGRRG